MKLQRQGHSECQIATIAMLADKPLAEVRASAIEWMRQISGRRVRTYRSIFKGGYFWKVINHLTERYGLPPTPHVKDCHRFITSLTLDDVQGEGQITIACGLTRGRAGHAVAYRYGIIFDPNFDAEMSLSQWIEKRRELSKSPFIRFATNRKEI